MMKIRAYRHSYSSFGSMMAMVCLGVLMCGPAARGAEREAGAASDSTTPSFTIVPELKEGFDLLYTQKHEEARKKFGSWESKNPAEPFGEVAIAASYLFEEFYRQGVLSSDYFLNEKKFLSGIDGKPDAASMAKFDEAI